MNRLDVIAQHIHLGCWLDDLPGVVLYVGYTSPVPQVQLTDADLDELTERLGEPRVNTSGRDGTLFVWSHPEGFDVQVFVREPVAA